MDLVSEVLVEVHRLQTLMFIQRDLHDSPRTLAELAEWFQMPLEDCIPLVEELAEEGYIAPIPPDILPAEVPLYSTAVAHGLLEWFRARSAGPGHGGIPATRARRAARVHH